MNAATEGDRVRLLLVEDDQYLRRAAEMMLRKQGFDVLAAADGQVGLALAREHRPEVVLLDLIMPGMQGFEVIEHLKADPATAAIPVVVMSALGQDDDVRRALAAGAATYVVKSNVALVELADKVRRLLSGDA